MNWANYIFCVLVIQIYKKEVNGQAAVIIGYDQAGYKGDVFLNVHMFVFGNLEILVIKILIIEILLIKIF